VLLLLPNGKKTLVRLTAGGRIHSHKGVIEHDDLIGEPYGAVVRSHLNHPFTILKPSLHDLLMLVKRSSQIIYPKEIGQILLRLNVSPGQRIIEAGSGSGALTLALAHSVQPEGMVYSYDKREEMLKVARHNIEQAGLSDCVTFTERDIVDGFCHDDVDALFLDVREPWEYLGHVQKALCNGGFFGALVPTTNQVSELLHHLQYQDFVVIEVLEMFIREYKPVPGRLRPQDQMVGHTGYLVFARQGAGGRIAPKDETDGTVGLQAQDA